MAMVLAAAGAAWASPATATATRPQVPQSFIRFVEDGHGGGSLQTADVAFQNRDGATVHLIAAVHIGEKSYYDALNRQFQDFDAVLYEMIKPRGAAPPAPGQAEQSDSDIAAFQRFLKDVLELDFQLDDIDYTAPNFVHADLDRETFEKLQEQRGESFESLMLQQMLNALNQSTTRQSDVQSLQDMVNVLTHPDMERQIKVVLARQMGEMDTAAMGLEGPGATVILSERNNAAMQTLSQTLAAGKKNVAIFYGSAHMPDLAKRLAAEGFEPLSTRWNLAWDLTIRPDQPSAVQKLFDGLIKSLQENK